MVASTALTAPRPVIGLSPAERQRLLQTGAMSLQPVHEVVPREPKKEPKFCVVRQQIERDLKSKIARIKADFGWEKDPAKFSAVQTYEDAIQVVCDRLQPKEH